MRTTVHRPPRAAAGQRLSLTCTKDPGLLPVAVALRAAGGGYEE
jgi:hypothetical protein